MTEKAVKEAELMVEASALKEDRVLVIYLPDCHESLAGIVAGRIRAVSYTHLHPASLRARLPVL